MAAVAYQHGLEQELGHMPRIMAAVGEAYMAPDKETLCITFHGGEITYDISKRKHWFVLATNDPPLEMEFVKPPTDVIGSTTSKSSTNDTAPSDSNHRKQPSPSYQPGGQCNNVGRQHEPITQGEFDTIGHEVVIEGIDEKNIGNDSSLPCDVKVLQWVSTPDPTLSPYGASASTSNNST
eukprot:PhF_6_TR23784/c1_g1_i2/m.33274